MQCLLQCRLTLGWLVTAALSYTCHHEVQPLYGPPALFLERTLRSCPFSRGEAPDYGELVSDLLDSLLEAEVVDRRSKAFKKLRFYNLYKTYFAPGVPRGAGMDTYEPSTAIYLARAKHSAEELPREESDALQAVLQFPSVPPCSTSHIACEHRGHQLRAIAVVAQVSELKALQLLGRLSELEALTLRLDHGVRLTREVLDALHWPKLKVLELSVGGPLDRLHEHLFNEVIGRHRSLQRIYANPGKYKEFEFSMSSWCGLRDLRDIALPDMNVHAFPDCFRQLLELRNVYVACNYLQAAPRALAMLPELRTFVAFRQGEYTPCHLEKDLQLNNLRNLDEKRKEYGDCELVWETALGDDGDDNPRILCPWVSLRGTLQDWMDLGWTKLEKLWLDGNFIAGQIPENLPQVWPKLKSLDLYRNELTGAIPASLAELQFDKLQLQGNHLSGAVPPALFRQRCCYFNIAANANLTGCVPAGTFEDRDWSKGIPGTKISACPSGGQEL